MHSSVIHRPLHADCLPPPSPCIRTTKPIFNGLKRRHARACRVPRAVWEEPATLAEIKQQMAIALKTEDYSTAARLRDAMQQMQVDARLSVEDANKSFYDAFTSGSIQAMDAVWGHGPQVQVIHPSSNCIAGREAVMESWRTVLAGIRPRAFRIELEDVRVHATDSYGVVTCVEVVDADDSTGRICATNVFEKQGDKWLLILHQGGSAVPMRRFGRIS